MTDTAEYDQAEREWRQSAPHRCFLCGAELQRGEPHDCPKRRGEGEESPTRDVMFLGPCGSSFASTLSVAEHLADRRFQLARDLLVAHVECLGMAVTPEPGPEIARERERTCEQALAHADYLIALLTEPHDLDAQRGPTQEERRR